MQKLPVFKAFASMIDSVVDNLGEAFAISWPWLVVMFPFRALANFYYLANGWLDGTTLTGKDAVAFYAIAMGIWLISGLAFASIAVNWHRFVLRGEVPEGWQRLRLDGLVWRYFFFGLGIVLLIYLIMLGGLFFFGLVAAGLGAISKGLAAVVAVVGLLVGLPSALLLFGLAARWSMKLVAVALGEIQYSIGDAYRVTAGNTWRLTGLSLLLGVTIIIIALLALVASYFQSAMSSSIAAAVLSAVEVCVGWFYTLVSITMLTSLYAFFVEKKEF
jgi:hypothetical protein